jgi:hypothetical protein
MTGFADSTLEILQYQLVIENTSAGIGARYG